MAVFGYRMRILVAGDSVGHPEFSLTGLPDLIYLKEHSAAERATTVRSPLQTSCTVFTATTIKSATNFFSLSPQIAASFFPFASTRYAWQLPLAPGFRVTIDVHWNGLCVGEIEKMEASEGTSTSQTCHTATLNLIPSLGAFTRSCLVPRYRSVVWTDAWPNSNWICSSSPPAARHNLAQDRRQSCGAMPGTPASVKHCQNGAIAQSLYGRRIRRAEKRLRLP